MKRFFDFERFVVLAEEALDTDYVKRLEKEQFFVYGEFEDAISQVKHYDGYYGENEQMLFNQVADAVQEVALADESRAFPAPVAELVRMVFDEAVERGCEVMMNNYGTFFYSGRIGEVNYQMAEKYYEMAANAGYDVAAENLGYIYYYGRTGKTDYAKAFILFAKGALVFNRPISTYKLGDMYRNGYFVEKDEKAAFKLYVKAESLLEEMDEYDQMIASPDVSFRLGNCYQKGTGTAVDLAKALEYYQLAERGFIEKIASGDFFMEDLLQQSIALQEEVRAELVKGLPEMDWVIRE